MLIIITELCVITKFMSELYLHDNNNRFHPYIVMVIENVIYYCFRVYFIFLLN